MRALSVGCIVNRTASVDAGARRALFRRMDESIQIVRDLLAGGAVDFDGEHFQLRDVRISPAPTMPVPILVGGRSDAAAEIREDLLQLAAPS